MDCRVKPGNDEHMRQKKPAASPDTAGQLALVTLKASALSP
jgi:hypothetical protein